MKPIYVHRHRNGTVQRVFDTWLETILPDGRTFNAVPRADQRNTAERLGYGGDIAALTRDHDVLHAKMAAWAGLPVSFSLAKAAGDDDDNGLAEAEEDAVMALQRFFQLAGVGVQRPP